MATRRKGPHGTLFVQIAPSAWRTLGKVPRDIFVRIQDALEEAADKLATEKRKIAVGHRTVEGFTAYFEIDDERRMLVLTRVDTPDDVR